MNMYKFLVYFSHGHYKRSLQPEEAQEKNIGIVVFLPPGCLRPKHREREREKDKTHDHTLYVLVSLRLLKKKSCDGTPFKKTSQRSTFQLQLDY